MNIGAGENSTASNLRAIYNRSAVPTKYRSPMTIKDFDAVSNGGAKMRSVVNGTNCLVPVTENEERNLKAQVTLRKLKLDLDLNKEASGAGKPGISALSSK